MATAIPWRSLLPCSSSQTILLKINSSNLRLLPITSSGLPNSLSNNLGFPRRPTSSLPSNNRPPLLDLKAVAHPSIKVTSRYHRLSCFMLITYQAHTPAKDSLLRILSTLVKTPARKETRRQYPHHSHPRQLPQTTTIHNHNNSRCKTRPRSHLIKVKMSPNQRVLSLRRFRLR